MGTTMRNMFYQASAFNQPLSFDTSSVTATSYMFYYATVFNQPLSFDTSSVTDMNGMFYEASVFNQPLSFDTSSVTGMNYMFYRALVFNQPLSFDTSSVTDMNAMFYSASSLSGANKLLIRCAWAGNSAFASAGYGSSSYSWGSGSCPSPPSPLSPPGNGANVTNGPDAYAAFIIGIMHQWHDGLIESANGINGLFDSANALVTGLSVAGSMVLSIAAIAVAIYDQSTASVPLAFTLATAASIPGAMPFPPMFGIPYLSIVGALVVLSWVLIVAVLLLMAAGEAVYTLVWGTPINIKKVALITALHTVSGRSARAVDYLPYSLAHGV